MSFNTWEHFDSPKTLFPYCNQSLNSNERVKWLKLQSSVLAPVIGGKGCLTMVVTMVLYPLNNDCKARGPRR